MEILSTGEKIKRARVYKGYTLRDICEDKISVSKMSCIENNKVVAEDWILDFVSLKLDLDVEYLRQGIKEQIETNIEQFEKDKTAAQFSDRVIYNLEFAEKYNYYNLAFKLMHLLFNYYLEKEKEKEKVQTITSRYYDLCQKAEGEEVQIIYYIDMARYLYINEEYSEAEGYYKNVKNSLKKSQVEGKYDFKNLIITTYNEAACNVMIKNYCKAYDVAIELVDLLDYVDKEFSKAEIYHMLAMLSLRVGKDDFDEYEKKSYEYYKDENSSKAYAIYNYSVVMFELNMKEKAYDYILKALECYPKTDISELVGFMTIIIDALIEQEILDKAQELCDEALNYAINLDDIKYIERTYYYKSIILQKQGSISSAEMYMNLSLDSLVKFGNNHEIYKRYMEMGNMYHKLGSVAESIKYFSLAIQLGKKM